MGNSSSQLSLLSRQKLQQFSVVLHNWSMDTCMRFQILNQLKLTESWIFCDWTGHLKAPKPDFAFCRRPRGDHLGDPSQLMTTVLLPRNAPSKLSNVDSYCVLGDRWGGIPVKAFNIFSYQHVFLKLFNEQTVAVQDISGTLCLNSSALVFLACQAPLEQSNEGFYTFVMCAFPFPGCIPFRFAFPCVLFVLKLFF